MISTLINEVLGLEDTYQFTDDGNVILPLTTLLRLIGLARDCQDSLEAELLPVALCRTQKRGIDA